MWLGANRFTERRRSESNRRIEVLQTSALPLGYGAELITRFVATASMLFLISAADLLQTSAFALGDLGRGLRKCLELGSFSTRYREDGSWGNRLLAFLLERRRAH